MIRAELTIIEEAAAQAARNPLLRNWVRSSESSLAELARTWAISQSIQGACLRPDRLVRTPRSSGAWPVSSTSRDSVAALGGYLVSLSQ